MEDFGVAADVVGSFQLGFYEVDFLDWGEEPTAA